MTAGLLQEQAPALARSEEAEQLHCRQVQARAGTTEARTGTRAAQLLQRLLTEVGVRVKVVVCAGLDILQRARSEAHVSTACNERPLHT